MHVAVAHVFCLSLLFVNCFCSHWIGMYLIYFWLMKCIAVHDPHIYLYRSLSFYPITAPMYSIHKPLHDRNYHSLSLWHCGNSVYVICMWVCVQRVSASPVSHKIALNTFLLSQFTAAPASAFQLIANDNTRNINGLNLNQGRKPILQPQPTHIKL